MKDVFVGLLVLTAIGAGGVYLLNSYLDAEKQAEIAADYKDAEYVIEGRKIKLTDGYSEIDTAPGSVSTIVTELFGSELVTDLDGDGREDIAFILTQERGGSGTFFYAVAALNTAEGYKGTDGYLLGDRIAPQSTP